MALKVKDEVNVKKKKKQTTEKKRTTAEGQKAGVVQVDTGKGKSYGSRAKDSNDKVNGRTRLYTWEDAENERRQYQSYNGSQSREPASELDKFRADNERLRAQNAYHSAITDAKIAMRDRQSDYRTSHWMRHPEQEAVQNYSDTATWRAIASYAAQVGDKETYDDAMKRVEASTQTGDKYADRYYNVQKQRAYTAARDYGRQMERLAEEDPGYYKYLTSTSAQAKQSQQDARAQTKAADERRSAASGALNRYNDAYQSSIGEEAEDGVFGKVRANAEYDAAKKNYEAAWEREKAWNTAAQYHEQNEREDLNKRVLAQPDFDAKTANDYFTQARDKDLERASEGRSWWTDSVTAPSPYTLLDQMTQDERAVYGYLLSKGMTQDANDYLNLMRDELQYRHDSSLAKERYVIDKPTDIDDTALKLLRYTFDSAATGLERADYGVRNVFERNGKEFDTEGSRLLSNATQQMEENGSEAGSFLYRNWGSAMQSLGQMAPAMLAGWAGGAIAGAMGTGMAGTGALSATNIASTAASVGQLAQNSVFFLSCKGNAYAEAKSQRGMSDAQAEAYSTLSALTEVYLQDTFGSVLEYGGIGNSQMAERINMLDNALERSAAKIGSGYFGEIFLDEVPQDFLDPFYETILTGKEYEAPTAAELLDTIASTAMMVSASNIGDSVSAVQQSQIKSNLRKIETLARELGQTDSRYQQLADHIGAYILEVDSHPETMAYTPADVQAVLYWRNGIERQTANIGESISQSQESVDAMRKYAEDNGMSFEYDTQAKTVQDAVAKAEEKAKVLETENEAKTEAENLDAEQEAPVEQTRAEKREAKKAEREETRQAVREAVEVGKAIQSVGQGSAQIVDSISKRMEGKTLAEIGSVKQALTEQYGSGIETAVNAAVERAVQKKYAAAETMDALQQTHREFAANVSDPALRQIDERAYNAQTYRLQENAAEGREARTSGRSMYAKEELDLRAEYKDGNSVQSSTVVRFADDGMSVVLDNGKTVAISQLAMDADAKDVLTKISKLGLTGKAASELFYNVKAYGQRNGAMGWYEYLTGFYTAYEQGRSGVVKVDEAVRRSKIDADAARYAYELGRRQVRESSEEAQAEINKQREEARKKGVTGRKGTVDKSGVDESKIGKSAQRSLKLWEAVSEEAGIDTVLFASKQDKDGKFVDMNGKYQDGKLWIDVNAGYYSARDVNRMRSGILRTVAHELTHFGQDFSPALYQQLKDFAFAVLGEELGADGFEDLIDSKLARDSTRKLTRQGAEDEIVADACEMMLKNSPLVQKALEQNPGLVEKLLGKAMEIIDAIREVFGSAVHKEAQIFEGLDDQLAELQERWNAMIEDAVQAHKEIGDNVIKDAEAIGSSEQMIEDAMTRHSDRISQETLDFLENQDHITVYRAMQEIDGKLYPPMAAKVEGKLVDPTEIGKWYQSVERPDLIDPKTGKWKLDKANGKAIKAAYNPYFHTSATPLNDQFSSAYNRPNLVVVQGHIPASELTSGYKAQYAKDSVGETKWHAGPVASQLKGDKARRVYLSRWFMADKIVSDAEVAAIVAKTLQGEDIAIPNNVVTPSLLSALKAAGVKIDSNAIERFESAHGMKKQGQRSDRDSDDIQTQINQSMTMQQAKRMLDRAFVVGNVKEWYDGEYKNADEWLRGEGVDAVALIIDNDRTLYTAFTSKIDGILNGDFMTEDILHAYLNNTLTGKEKAKAQKIDTASGVAVSDPRFYALQAIQNAKEVFDTANQRMTNSNREDVIDARAKILLYAHNKGAAETLGLTEAELNRKLRSWSNYRAAAKDISARINSGVSEANRWTGIENSAYIVKASVSNEDIARLVNKVEGDGTGYETRYLARTMLALDTHIDWSWLNIKFDTRQGVNYSEYSGTKKITCNGYYLDNERLIHVTRGSPNTVAHEMGHALDHQWGRDLGMGLAITESYRNSGGMTGEARVWFEHAHDFIDTLVESSDIRSEYSGRIAETFARFVDRFVMWTEQLATGYQSREYAAYSDKFTASQFIQFAKLLQEKAAIDAKGLTKNKLDTTGQAQFSERDEFAITDEEALMQADASIAENDEQRALLREYQKKAHEVEDLYAKIEEQQQALADVRKERAALKGKLERRDAAVSQTRESLQNANKSLQKETKANTALKAKVARQTAQAEKAQQKAAHQQWLTETELSAANFRVKLRERKIDKQEAEIRKKDRELRDKETTIQNAIQVLQKQVERGEQIMDGKLGTKQMQALLKKVRDTSADYVKEQKNAQIKKMREGRKVRELKGRIANLRKDLMSRLMKPSDRVFVPAELAKPLAEVLNAIEAIGQPKAGTKALTKYMRSLEAANQMANAMSDFMDPAKNKNYDEVYEFEYGDEIKEDIATIQRIFDAKKEELLKQADLIAGDPSRSEIAAEFTADELQQIYDAVKHVKDTFQQSSKLFNSIVNKDIYSTARGIRAQTERMTVKGIPKRLRRMIERNRVNTMRAVEIMSGFDRSSPLYQLMAEIEDGTDTANRWIMGYEKRFNDLKVGKNEKTYRDFVNKRLDYGLETLNDDGTPTGRTVKITKQQAMQIVLSWDREAANENLEHLQRGGFSVATENSKPGNPDRVRIKPTPQQIDQIRRSFTAWDRSYIKAFREYVKAEAAATNNVLYILKHRILQTEDNYIPFKVDSGYLDAKITEQNYSDLFVKNFGATEKLMKQSALPIMIDGMETMMQKHVSDAANYIGLAIPIRNFAKVYNARMAMEGESPVTVQSVLKNAWGDAGGRTILNTLAEIQGVRSGNNWRTEIGDHLNALQSAFVKSALLINPSVTIKQAASYYAAFSILDQRAITAGNRPIFTGNDKSKAPTLIAYIFANPRSKTAQRLYNEIDKYTAEHQIRRKGMDYREMGDRVLNEGSVGKLVGKAGAALSQNAVGRGARKALSVANPVNWIQRMDVATTAALWVACKKQAELNGYKRNSDAYWAETTQLYKRCLRETQPMYDPLHRAGIQKQEGLIKYLFPFRTVPIQNHGQIAMATEAWRYADKGDRAEAAKFLRKTVWAQAGSAMIFVLMTAIAAGLKRKTGKYRDDDDELTLESVLLGLGSDYASVWFSNIFPVAGGDIFEAASNVYKTVMGKDTSNYDTVSVGVVDMINNLGSSAYSMIDAARDLIAGETDDPQRLYDKLMTFGLNMATAFGIPAKTIKSYIQGAVGNVNDLKEGNLPAWNDDAVERAVKTNVNRFLTAEAAGDEEKMEKVIDELTQHYLALGRSDKEAAKKVISDITAEVKKRYKAGEYDDERAVEILTQVGKKTDDIESAMTALYKDLYTSGDIDENEATELLLQYGGKDENEAYWLIRKWDFMAEHEDDDEKWSEYNRLREALASGEGVEDAMEELSTHGKRFVDINSDIKDTIIARYQKGEISQAEAEAQLAKYWQYKENGEKTYHPATKDDIYWALEKAEYKAETKDDEDADNWSKYLPLREAVAANKPIDKIKADMMAHGLTESQIDGEVKDYLNERFRAGEIDETQYKNLLAQYLQIVKTDVVEKMLNDGRCYKEYGVTAENIDDAYKDGTLTAAQTKKALKKYAGMDDTAAQNRIDAVDFNKAHKELSWSVTGAESYLFSVFKLDSTTKKYPSSVFKSARDFGFTPEEYDEYLTGEKDLTWEAGVTGAKKKVYLAYIDSLDISDAKKDWLFCKNSYAWSDIKNAPWHK